MIIPINMMLVLHIGITALLVSQCADALVIKDEAISDTEYYVAPATYTRKNGKQLPSTIIISRPLGVKADSSEDDSGELILSQGSFSLVSIKDDDDDDDRDEGSVGIKPNMQFYKIECSTGQSCTSIIPARTTNPPDPPEIPFTRQELKDYLAQFGLYNGFQYDDDFESSGTPQRPENPTSDRAFGSDYYGGNSYWPGSSYRPGYNPNNNPSVAQIFKYQGINSEGNSRPYSDFPTMKPRPSFSSIRPFSDFPTRRPSDFPARPPMKWNKIGNNFPTKIESKWEQVRPVSNDRFHNPNQPNSHELPKPLSFTDDAIQSPYGPPRPTSPTRPSSRPTSYDGVWNRYSMSTVSQLDRDTGEWVKVSSNSKRLDQGLFGLSPDNHNGRPGRLPPATHHTKASLTVLGISDREPHSAFGDSDDLKPHIVKVPSSHPGNPPETIETAGGRAAGI